MFKMLQKTQLQLRASPAELRERDAECSQISSNSSDSEWILAVSNWLLAPDEEINVSEMSSVAQATA
jgi:hypothetical protein